VKSKLLGDVSKALKFLHDQRVMHRDLKPANILAFDGPTLKLTDFGFAKRLNEDSQLHSYLGTPFFMAPEVFSQQAYERAADVFSLGAASSSASHPTHYLLRTFSHFHLVGLLFLYILSADSKLEERIPDGKTPAVLLLFGGASSFTGFVRSASASFPPD